MDTSSGNSNNNGNPYSSSKFFYNNALLLFQVLFGLIAVGFSAVMLATGHPAEVYLPVITGITSYFLPSPINHKVEQPASIPQIRDLLSRTLNIV